MRSSAAFGSILIGSVLILTACGERFRDSSTPLPPKTPSATLAPGEIVPWADIPAPLATRKQPEIPPLQATLSSPPSARAGETLRYQLALRNTTGQPYRWPTECPVYLAILQTPPPEPRNVAGAHQQLNCRLARDLSPNDEVRFELQFALPAEVPAGQWILGLSFTQPGHSASPPATAILTIER